MDDIDLIFAKYLQNIFINSEKRMLRFILKVIFLFFLFNLIKKYYK